MPFISGNYEPRHEVRAYLVWNGEERLHLKIDQLIMIVQRVFVCPSRLRRVSVELIKRLNSVQNYAMELKTARVNKAKHVKLAAKKSK